MPYSQTSFPALIAALLQRLQDTGGVFTSTAEAQIYLIEGLRALNAQSGGLWNVDYIFPFGVGEGWKSLNIPNSPRQRTVTDTAIETQMEYMLLEPPTGQTWTGTSQFNITNLSNALQYRRDELLLMSGANMVNLTTLNSPTASVRTFLPDSTLGVQRVRWIPASPSPETPYALWREDRTSVNAFGELLSLTPGPPESWLITANSPLAFDISSIPNNPGTWDLLNLNAGAALTPPTASIINLPDDWSWVAMYGALADVFSNSPEATDNLRAKYCLSRYERGMKAMMALPWLLAASIQGVPVDTPSYVEMDAYAQNWEQVWSVNDPQIVVGGMDFIALAPFNVGQAFGTGGFGGGPFGGSTTPIATLLTVVGNAPVDPTQPVQLSPDGIDAILAYAQHLAMFKRGGSEFAATLPLYEQFEAYCRAQNDRYNKLGIFRPEMILEGSRGEQIDPRFSPELLNVKR